MAGPQQQVLVCVWQVLEACCETGSAPARDGLGHAWAVTTCRQRLARAHLLAGRPHSALQEVTRALQHAPQGYGAHSLHTLAAEAHLEAGEHAEAQAALSRALAAHPHHVPAHLTFSRMLQANVSSQAIRYHPHPTPNSTMFRLTAHWSVLTLNIYLLGPFLAHIPQRPYP